MDLDGIVIYRGDRDKNENFKRRIPQVEKVRLAYSLEK